MQTRRVRRIKRKRVPRVMATVAALGLSIGLGGALASPTGAAQSCGRGTPDLCSGGAGSQGGGHGGIAINSPSGTGGFEAGGFGQPGGGAGGHCGENPQGTPVCVGSAH